MDSSEIVTQIEQAVQDFWERALIAPADEARERELPGDDPEGFPGPDRPGCVRLDVAIAALHYMKWVVIFRGLPRLMGEKAREVIRFFTGFIVRTGGELVGLIRAAWFLPAALLDAALQAFEKSKVSAQLGQTIVDGSTAARRGLIDLTLSQRKGKRRFKEVRTRHYSPKQRKANGHSS